MDKVLVWQVPFPLIFFSIFFNAEVFLHIIMGDFCFFTNNLTNKQQSLERTWTRVLSFLILKTTLEGYYKGVVVQGVNRQTLFLHTIIHGFH